MHRDQPHETQPGVIHEGKNRKEILLKYNSESLDAMINEQATLETALTNDFIDILSQNNIDLADVDSGKTMYQVMNEYISNGKIDENETLVIKWLEKNILSQTLEHIIRAKQGEQKQATEQVDHKKITATIDRIRAIVHILETIPSADEEATKKTIETVKESINEINRLIDTQKSLEAYRLSKKLIRDLESKYKIILEQQKDQVETNFALLLTKLKIADQFGIKLPTELIDILNNLTKKARKEHVSKALEITEHMKEMVNEWLQSQDNGMTVLLQSEPAETKKKRETKKLKNLEKTIQFIKTTAAKARISESALPLSDIQVLIDLGDLDTAMKRAEEVLEYVQLTSEPKASQEKKIIVQNPLETPLTQSELDRQNLEYAPNILDDENITRHSVKLILNKTQARLDYAAIHPETLTEKEENGLRRVMGKIQKALDEGNMKKAFSLSDTLSKAGALLAPLESDYNYKSNVFHKAAKKQRVPGRKKPATFKTATPKALLNQDPANDWDGLVLPETVILPVEKEATPSPRATKVGKRRPPVENSDILEVSELSEPLSPEPAIESVQEIIPEPDSLTEVASFDDTEPFIEDETEEPLQANLPSPVSEIRQAQPTEQNLENNVAETPLEQDFFQRGEEIDTEHQAIAQEKPGFFSRVFDKIRPSRQSAEDKLIRILQKEKWLNNIPKMSHKDVLTSLKKFGVDITGGAVDDQLKRVGPLLRSDSETGEVFKALWDKYLETQIHEKKKWEEAIPNMDIDQVYLNLEKFGINPDDDGRRDVRAKIIALRNESSERGKVFRMLYDKYIEIQNNNIRALAVADQKQIIQFLKQGYKLDATHFFEDTKNEKLLQHQKHIELMRREFSSRGKVIDAAVKRLEELYKENARANIEKNTPRTGEQRLKKAA